MDELNGRTPVEVEVIDGFSFKLKLDTFNFKPYQREGLVENVKMPKQFKFHSLKQSVKNPIASSAEGMLAVPDFRFFGRSDQLHLALTVIWQF